MRAHTIVVVEDEATIASAIAARLRKEGFEVEVAGDGPAAVELCDRVRPDLVVLDLMLPGFDGLEVCRRIQRDRPVAVLMLTARDSETDMLVGLGVGADDYMTKPFSMRELVARVHAILRRVQKSPADAGRPVKVADIAIDPGTREVRKDDQVVHLTPIEFDLLLRLASHPNIVHTRDRLMVEVWGYRDALGGRTVDTHVGALRKKIGADLIRTVHGVGYAFNPPS
ncbi:MAG TPA: response regulator transcription factor [Actinomycetota bacterium]|nr:response regulator transcription factor [Actinomycetota bacterium]